MKYLKFFTLVAIIFFSSCSSPVNRAQKTATLFYYYAMRQDYKDIIPLLDKQMLKNVPAQKWTETLQKLQLQRGPITKYNPTKVEIYKDADGHLIVRFLYKVYYERATHTEELLIIQRQPKGPFKILKYTYNYHTK